jgi:hypothetical protein
MSRRRLLLFGVTVVIVVVLGVGGWLLLPRTVLNEEDCLKIMDVGMNSTEFEAILGKPAAQSLAISPIPNVPANTPIILKRWFDGRNTMEIWFTEDGSMKVAHFQCGPYPLPVESLPGGEWVAARIWDRPMRIKTFR